MELLQVFGSSNCKLPLVFDPEPLKSDLEAIQSQEWVAHFNTGYYDGQWMGIALRSVGGVPTQLYPDPNTTEEVIDTPILERCAHIRSALARFQCPIRSARLLKLGPGSTIREHRDYNLGFEDGEIRLHVPILSNDRVEFFLDAHRFEMNEGECWYLDFNLPHSVRNTGTTDRVHLVIDCTVNEWLEKMLKSVASQTSADNKQRNAASVRGGWKEFCAFVLREPGVHQRLCVTEDRDSFIRLAVATGEDFGFRFLPADVEEEWRAARRAWIERWIE